MDWLIDTYFEELKKIRDPETVMQAVDTILSPYELILREIEKEILDPFDTDLEYLIELFRREADQSHLYRGEIRFVMETEYGLGGIRTRDPRIKSPLLCRLSYQPELLSIFLI